MNRLFVYGSLRAGVEHPMHAVLRDAAQPAGAARVRGRLYAVDWYPGLVVDPAAPWVVGELWSDVDPAVWTRLDAYEGCATDSARPHEFTRIRTPVDTPRGSREAWVYRFEGDTAGLEWVTSGDWLRR